MAYDPKDPADKKIVDDLIAAALSEANEEHELSIAGLKKKNGELLAKLKDANKDGNGDPAEVSRLENELEVAQKQLKDTTKELNKTKGSLEETTKSLDTERGVSTDLLVDGGLTEALTKAKVAPDFMPAVKALLRPKAAIKVEGEDRKVFVGDKSLGDYIIEWSQGDEGKHYVSADINGGGGAGGNKVAGSGKTMTRAAFEAVPVDKRGAVLSSGVTLTD